MSFVLQRADLCQTMKKLDLLGSNPCTWGPSYWCQNRETAQKCGVGGRHYSMLGHREGRPSALVKRDVCVPESKANLERF